MQPELRLYDTAARAKRPFEPIDHENIRLYACGPTVYDLAHIGNARPVIVFDVLFRLLRHRYGAGHVTYVRNVTDVDDKINARAAERGIPIRELTDGTLAQFHKDIAALGVLMPEDVNVPGEPPRMIEPRATDHIPEMRDLIERLLARGHAYVAQDHALFDVPSMAAYGRLSRRPLDEMVAGARVEVAPYKRSPLDFVLWKPSREGEPAWPSPGGIPVPGRPGWHIECSAMSWRHLVQAFEGRIACEPAEAQTFDIHAGGLDLIFPHHENEIAQSCCALGTERMANYWLHNGFLQVEGAKLAKSAGNFTTIRDVLRDWPGEVVRLAMLRTHYRQPIDWTVRRLEESRRELNGYADIFDEWAVVEAPSRPSEGVLEALGDDLNTPLALTRLREETNSVRDRVLAERLLGSLQWLGLMHPSRLGVFDDHLTFSGSSDGVEWQGASDAVLRIRAAYANGDAEAGEQARSELLQTIPGATVAVSRFGYVEIRRASAEGMNAVVSARIAARTAARAARNFAESDRLRDELAALGVKLTDHKDGTTTWEVAR